mmetsp:Transcript_119951/g.208328  ORF Transcript_119951/g.208328 Transcript_119951/m.208328 type:complete len:90 (-) Transcript_119951:120-389(-)
MRRGGQNKVRFKFTLAAERSPFKVIAVPEEAPFSACVRFAAEEFEVDHSACTLATTDEGVNVDPKEFKTAGQAFLWHGANLKLTPKAAA